MKKLFCEKCRENVEYNVIQREANCEVKGKKIKFIEIASCCVKCGTELDDEDHEEENFRRIQEKLDEIDTEKGE